MTHIKNWDFFQKKSNFEKNRWDKKLKWISEKFYLIKLLVHATADNTHYQP
jgi:hypothetical protein